MPISVRKSICLAPMAAALCLSLSLGLAVGKGSAQGQPSQQPVQVKKLDDDKEVLRPIPTVLKAKSESHLTKTAATTTTTATNPPTTLVKPTVAADKKASLKEDNTRAQSNKTTASEKKSITRIKTAATTNRGAHFVPPPPPTTPTMLGDGADFGFYSGMPIEMLSREGLKDKAKEISIQYKDACRELDDHSKQKEEKIERAKEFEGLFNEGVVSRRELESSRKEAAEVNSDIDRLSLKVKELKGLLDRVNKRMSQTAAKKSGHKLIN